MANLTISEMRKWLANKDPNYGGHIGWVNKVKQWSDNQVLAVYRSRQEAIARDSVKKKVEEEQLKGLPTIIDDIEPSVKEQYHQITLMDVFGDEMKKVHRKNCERVTSY